MQTFAAVVLALALMVAVSVQAHDNPTNPTHKHGLEIKRIDCGGDVETAIVAFQESTRECLSDWNWRTGKKTPRCSYTCLWRTWATWNGSRHYEPSASYNKCHIENSHTPTRAKAMFHPSEPSWNQGVWGVVVRDGWGQEEVRGVGHDQTLR